MRSRAFIGRAILVGGLTSLGLTACGGAGSSKASTASTAPAPTMVMPASAAAPSSPAVATDAVTIRNFAFTPAVIRVKAGTTVTWTNRDDEAHTVFFAFDRSVSPVLVNATIVYRKTFTTPGSFAYHCTIHPFMVGTVEVTA